MRTVAVHTSLSPTRLGKLHENLTYNEGKAVYVSEAGLYSLIMSSQAPFAKEFRKLVCKIILPSIRKYGSYQIEQQFAESMQKLAIKETVEEELKHQTEQLEQRVIKAERKSLNIRKFMNRITIKEQKMEWIYIGTTRLYAQERVFKIGSTTRLTSRIPQYNTGRPGSTDHFYYAWAMKCYNSKDVDYHIQKLLLDFKFKDPKKIIEEQVKDNRAEMYHGIKFSDLKDILTFVINNYDQSMEYINNFIRARLDQSLEEEDEVPPPLDLKRVICQIGDHEEVLDVAEGDETLLRGEFENILTNLKEQHQRNKEDEKVDEIIVVDRKDLVGRLISLTNDIKKSLWTRIKELTGWTNSNTEIDEGSFKYKIMY